MLFADFQTSSPHHIQTSYMKAPLAILAFSSQCSEWVGGDDVDVDEGRRRRLVTRPWIDRPTAGWRRAGRPDAALFAAFRVEACCRGRGSVDITLQFSKVITKPSPQSPPIGRIEAP